ncbi:MAG: rhodanese-like domain-containing protein [Chloroflexota bacterium]
MYRRNKERRTRRNRREEYNRPSRGFTSAFRRPGTQIALLAVVALVIYLILQVGGRTGNNAPASVPSEISVGDAYTKYESGVFVLDVRTQEEWNEFHAPNTTLIPLDQLPARLSEIPTDKEIVVVCRSGNRSQQARDILLNAGFEQVSSMAGGLNEWRASGYPIEP